MSTIKTNDGTDIYYKDWGTGPAVVFSHGWPLCSDAAMEDPASRGRATTWTPTPTTFMS